MYIVQQLFHKIPTKHIIKHLKISIVNSCVILIQVAVVSNNQSINELPKIEGQLSYIVLMTENFISTKNLSGRH